MGNDIFSNFINKNKIMNLRFAEIFFKYTVHDKNKLNKSLEKIIDIYTNLFYYVKLHEIEELDNYFLMKNSNDTLLKETLLSTVLFYKENNLENKIESDIGTIIILSNTVYLSLILGDINNSDEDLVLYVNSFFNKYKNKIRIKEEDRIEELKKELVVALKEEFNQFKKFFKLFSGMQYSVETEQILDYDGGYLVNLLYDIKMLSKFSLKEIEQTKNNRGINLDNSIITLELTMFKIIQDVIKGNINNKYFIQVDVSLFEKQKYRQAVDTIFSNNILKDKIIFIFNYDNIKGHNKILEDVKNFGYQLAVNKINNINVSKNSFDNLKYIFVSHNFLEYYEGYLDIWKAKNIIIIVSGGC